MRKNWTRARPLRAHHRARTRDDERESEDTPFHVFVFAGTAFERGMAEMHVWSGGNGAETTELSMSDEHGTDDATVDLRMSGDGSEAGGVALPGPDDDYVAFENDEHVAVSGTPNPGHMQHPKKTKAEALDILMSRPAEFFLQSSAAVTLPGAELWCLPLQDGVSGDLAWEILGFEVAGSQSTYRYVCDFIERNWHCSAAHALPQIFRKSTPYSLALLLQLRMLASSTEGDLLVAHTMLHDQWARRLRLAGLEPRNGAIVLQSTIVSGHAVRNRGKSDYCEQIIQENVYGVTLEDVAMTYTAAKAERRLVSAVAEARRKDNAKTMQQSNDEWLFAKTQVLAVNGVDPGRVDSLLQKAEQEVEGQERQLKRAAKNRRRHDKKEAARRTAFPYASTFTTAIPQGLAILNHTQDPRDPEGQTDDQSWTPTPNGIRTAGDGEQAPDNRAQPVTTPEAANNRIDELLGALLESRLHTNDKAGPGTMDAARAARFRSHVNRHRRAGKASGGLPMESLDFGAVGDLQEGLDAENVKTVTQAMQETTLWREQE
ncbi:hypothetical protein LTR86_010855 [Recurvomyces mirabilis]|nr:hypothetical protein LTR86_010855 [Recurvomyces mirabilis]